MGVEAGCFRVSINKQDKLYTSSIKKGDIDIIDFIKPMRVLVVCDADNTKGTVWVKNSYGVAARIFEDDEDEKGREVNLRKPVKFSDPQFIALLDRYGRRGMLIAHSREDDEDPGNMVTPPAVDDLIGV